MALNKPDVTSSTRAGPQPSRSIASRLPARKLVPPPTPLTKPGSSPVVLTKRKPVSSKEKGQATATRQLGSNKVSSGNLIKPEANSRLIGSKVIRAPVSTENGIGPQSRQAIQQTPRIPRLDPPRTPSLVSGSSISSTVDSPRSNALRRKRSNIERPFICASPDSLASREDVNSSSYEDPYPDAVLGITVPSASRRAKVVGEEVINLDRFAVNPTPLATDDLPPPTPLYALSGTSSAGYSPGPFSISSTPTSMTSCSPGIAAAATSARPSPHVRQLSPSQNIPPASQKVTAETTSSLKSSSLAPVRETSSSSSSTVRASDKVSRTFKGTANPIQKRSAPRQSTQSGVSRSTSSPVRKGSDHTLQIRPPELAHLSTASPHKGPGGNPKPERPSRQGAPEMNFDQASPVIQSNLSSLPPNFHRRQGSAESRKAATTGPLALDTKTRFGIPRKSSSRNPSPSPTQSSAISPLVGGIMSNLASDGESSSKNSKPSTSVEKSQSRFGFFTRRTKTEPALPSASKDKRLRKGPAAGTGHEGYSKFGLRGRSGSTTSGSGNTSVGRSSSADSLGRNVTQPSSRKSSVGSRSGSDVDEFLAERLNPIPLRGAGTSRPIADPARDDGGHEFADGSNCEPDCNLVQELAKDVVSKPTLLPSLMPDLRATSPVKTANRNATQAGNQKSHRFGIPNLAARRASRRSMLDEKLSSAIRAAIDEDLIFPSHPAINPLERKISEPSSVIGSSSGNGPVSENEINSPARSETRLKPQSKASKKWNFFQRAKSPTKKEKRSAEIVAVTVPRQSTPRPVAHYAMMDAPEQIDVQELERIMLEAESLPDQESNADGQAETGAITRSAKHGNSILLPAPPSFVPEFAMQARPASPKVSLRAQRRSVQFAPEVITVNLDEPVQASVESAQPPSRPSRLAQVGRIPKVVSKRERERKPPSASFSRPFGPSRPSPAMQDFAFQGDDDATTIATSPDMSSPDRTYSLDTSNLIHDSKRVVSRDDVAGPPGFLTFSTRQNSDVSNTSSGSGIVSFAKSIAVLGSNSPARHDDVWNEYDDLLDSLSPRTPKTPLTGSSCGAPFHYALSSPAEETRLPYGVPFPVPSVSNFARRLRFPSARESQLLSPLAFPASPSSPTSVSDFFVPSTERVTVVPERMSLPPAARSSTSTNRFSLPPKVQPPSGSLPGQSSPPSTDSSPLTTAKGSQNGLGVAQIDTRNIGPESMANLRFGALMTSKWLSFGRVLFSPAHLELKKSDDHRILILDGLGKDWSYYVALTYPNATIYNLGTDPVDSVSKNTSGSGPFQSLPNHRHIYHPNISSPFPFPKGFFTAVVFRFPIATTEAIYRFAISECKRVLRPGGHLEISVLDIDMLNMGNRTRRAVRALKVQIQARDSSISLKPMSDTIQRLLGRRGFENLNRCMVGVPAAGRVPGSREGSSALSPGSVSPTKGSAIDTTRTMPSFSDLLRDQSSEGDECITQMVARVARWWYSSCYESLVPEGNTGGGLWADEGLLRECEKRGTSLRLMVCFAQKPECAVRRTISV